MNVWTDELKRGDKVEVGNGEDKFNRIFVAYIEGSISPYVCVSVESEENYHNGEPFLTAKWEHARRIPEKKYRPFTGEELADLPGMEIRNDRGESHTVKEYCKAYYKLKSPFQFVRIFDSKVEITPEILLRYWTFPDGTPCGVEEE